MLRNRLLVCAALCAAVCFCGQASAQHPIEALLKKTYPDAPTNVPALKGKVVLVAISSDGRVYKMYGSKPDCNVFDNPNSSDHPDPAKKGDIQLYAFSVKLDGEPVASSATVSDMPEVPASGSDSQIVMVFRLKKPEELTEIGGKPAPAGLRVVNFYEETSDSVAEIGDVYLWPNRRGGYTANFVPNNPSKRTDQVRKMIAAAKKAHRAQMTSLVKHTDDELLVSTGKLFPEEKSQLEAVVKGGAGLTVR